MTLSLSLFTSFRSSNSLKSLSYFSPRGLPPMCLQALSFCTTRLSAINIFWSFVLCLMPSVAASTRSMDGSAKNSHASNSGHAMPKAQLLLPVPDHQREMAAPASSQFRVRVVLLAAQALWAPSLLTQELWGCFLPLRLQNCANLSFGCLSRHPGNSSSGFYLIFWTLSPKDRGMSPLVLSIKHPQQSVEFRPKFCS